MKNGLLFEDNELIYYKDGVPVHAGIICVDGDYYYISSKGRAVKGEHIVHSEMTNGLVKRGTYRFGEDYKMIPNSYRAPRSSKRKKKHSLQRKLKKTLIGLTWNRKYAIIALAIILLLLLFFDGAYTSYLKYEAPVPKTTAEAQNERKVKITLPEFPEDVILTNDYAHQEYLGTLPMTTAVEGGEPYQAMEFNYYLENTTGFLQVSEQPDYSGAIEFILQKDTRGLLIDNLKTDTTYYYRAIIDGEEFPGTFHTAPGNRFVSIPGLKNTRDIGGYKTLDGKTVKQGLVIRGVEIDGMVNAPYFIPDADIPAVQKTFGFVYDMDLRTPDVYNGAYTSRLGKDVAHKFYSAPMYGQVFTEAYIGSLRQIFADLANPSNYPMYLHCTWGTDRTGTIVFLLQGVLNVSEEDMRREYLLTAYASPKLVESTNMDVLVAGFAPFEGDTLQEKIVTYLTTIVGVTEQEINSIRTIFLQ